jgi:hypothetical protein
MDETVSSIDLSIDEIAPADDITAEQPDAYAAPHYRTLTLSPLASTTGSFSEKTLAENSSLALAAETKDVPEFFDSGATTFPESPLPASNKADPILTSPEIFPKEVGTPHLGTDIREAIETLPLMTVPLPVDFIPLSRSQTATSQPDSEPPTTASTPQETTASEPTEETASSDQIVTEVGVRDDPSLAFLDPTNPLHQPLLLGRI